MWNERNVPLTLPLCKPRPFKVLPKVYIKRTGTYRPQWGNRGGALRFVYCTIIKKDKRYEQSYKIKHIKTHYIHYSMLFWSGISIYLHRWW
jgi:hypothetical protein